mgnify:CR=1 FL=1
MTPAGDTLFDRAQGALRSVATEAREFLALRAELLSLEFRLARHSLAKLAGATAFAVVAILVSLPVMLVAAADMIETRFAVPSEWTLGACGSLLLVAAGLVGWRGWRKFRRDFAGLEDSIAELQEDLVWLSEWLGAEPKTDRQQPSPQRAEQREPPGGEDRHGDAVESDEPHGAR